MASKIYDRLSAIEQWHPRDFQPILEALVRARPSVYVVGGAVRDYLLNRDQSLADLDLVLEGPVLSIARQVANRLGWAYYALDEARDVARLVRTARTNGADSPPLVCDISSIRNGDITGDLLARDFTVNALALRLERDTPPTLVDYCNGVADLERRVLRRVTPRSLVDDPLRLLRAVRLKAQLQFEIEPETRFQIRQLAATVEHCSAERVRDELWKILAQPMPNRSVEELRSLMLLRHVLPEVAATLEMEQSYPHHLDVYRHTLLTLHYADQLRQWLMKPGAGTVAALAPGLADTLKPWEAPLRAHFGERLASDRRRAQWLVWHALLHDVGKAETRTAVVQADGSIRYRFLGHDKRGAELTANRLSRLQFSSREVQLGRAVVRHHMRPHLLHNRFDGGPISRRALYRFFNAVSAKRLGALAALDVVLLGLADYQATYENPYAADWPEYLAHVRQMLDFALDDGGFQATKVHPLVDGYTLMAHLGLEEGPLVGRLLKHLQEAQVAGDINTADEALELATKWMRRRIQQ